MKKWFNYVIPILGLFMIATSADANAANITKQRLSKLSSQANKNTSTPTISQLQLLMGQKTISGIATKGTVITVKTNPKAKDSIAMTTASVQNGKFTLKLPTMYKAGTKLYVYARDNNTSKYFYRIVNVKNNPNKVTSNGNVKKDDSIDTTSTKNKSNFSKKTSITLNDISGTWKSNSNNNGKYTQYTFDVNNGFSEINVENGKSTPVIQNASYQIIKHSSDLWQVNYKTDKNNGSIYFHLNSNNQFYVTNAGNQVTSVSYDNLFNQVK